MNFGKKFKYYRVRANLTQREAAEKIGIKDYQLGNYETNRSEPSLDILKQMSRVYSISIDKMLGNNLVSDNVEKESKEESLDMNELLEILNDTVDKINKANK